MFLSSQKKMTKSPSPCHNFNAMNLKNGLKLEKTENGLVLTDGKLSLMADFSTMLSRVSSNKIGGEALIKAAKQGEGLAVDATAGLGEDSFLLAAAGYKVLMIEKNPVIAKLLQDAIDLGMKNEDLAPIVSRMSLVEGDSVEILTKDSKTFANPAMIYLDPMFPGRTKSGLIKKKFQLLQQLEAPEENPEELFFAARAINPGKIIVKRPAKEAPITNNIKPTYTISGNVIRYDCYFFPENN